MSSPLPSPAKTYGTSQELVDCNVTGGVRLAAYSATMALRRFGPIDAYHAAKLSYLRCATAFSDSHGKAYGSTTCQARRTAASALDATRVSARPRTWATLYNASHSPRRR
jgi:hypothetical protein